MTATPGHNGGYGDGPYQVYNNRTVDFTIRCQEQDLSPLRFVESSLPDILITLENYLSVLRRGASVALNRGENLASARLARSMESLFSLPAPLVTEGPSLTWAMLILSIGPNFDGPRELKIGESDVKLSENDFELIRSGRPWRFLCPWPDKEDCISEIQSTETALQELLHTRQIMNKVLEEISLVEQKLKHRHDAVSQIKNSYRTASQDLPGQVGPHSRFPSQNETSNSPVRGEDSGYRASSSAAAHNHVVAHDQACRPITADINGPNNREYTPPEGGIHPDNQRALGNTAKGTRLHRSDFIQSLSDILDESMGGEAIRWSEDGRSFLIASETKFPAHLLSRLSAKSYGAFVRRLYYFGFRKIKGAYRHDLFVRGQPSSIQPVRRMSCSPSLSSRREGSTQRGPRYKVVKRKQSRQSA